MKKVLLVLGIILVVFFLVDGCVEDNVGSRTRDHQGDDVEAAELAKDSNNVDDEDAWGDDDEDAWSEDEESTAELESSHDEEAEDLSDDGDDDCDAEDLVLPAERTDGRYPEAVIYEIESQGVRNYAVYYDAETYTPLWVAYTLSAHHMGSNKRPSGWDYNPYISTSDQVNLCSRSYEDDYSRGHLIPNASRNGNREMQLQTFYVTNSVPQIQNKFNGGIWQRLESALQGIAQQETIYIVTGVAFAKPGERWSISYTKAKDDTKRVPVPNYFYKVVLKVKTDRSGAVTDACSVGFWFEHRTYSDSFDKYAVSVDQIEQWTGFDYFPALANNLETRAEQNSSWKVFKSW